MEKVVEKLDCINHTLERQNRIIQQMLDIMPRPASKFTRVLETAVLFIAVFGFINIVDTIRKWIIGG